MPRLGYNLFVDFQNTEATRYQEFILRVLNSFADEVLMEGVVEYIPTAVKDKYIVGPNWVVYNKVLPQTPIFIGLSFKDETGDWPVIGFWVGTSISPSGAHAKLSRQSLTEAISKVYISSYLDKR